MLQISVVLPTYNRLSRLKDVISALEAQTLPNEQFEVVIVSDGSSDGTNQYLQTVDTPLQLRPIVQENQGAAAARNTGYQAAQADLILFIDDDIIPAPTLVSYHLEVQNQHSQGVVVIGPMLTPDGFDMQPWVLWEQTMLNKQYNSMSNREWAPTPRQFYTGNTSLPRRFLEKVDGFDTSFRRAEDVELAYRLAEYDIPFLFEPQAVGYHYAERSFKSWQNIAYAYGRNDVIFTRTKEQKWLLPNLLHEFWTRHAFIRLLAYLLLDRPRLTQTAVVILHTVATVGHNLNLLFLPRFAYSGIFNLLYYQGISDMLDGRRREFFQLTEHYRDKQNVPATPSPIQLT